MTTSNVLSASDMAEASNICMAKTRHNDKKKDIAIQSLSKTITITDLAEQNEVSRKFVYEQKEKAESAIKRVFEDKKEDEEKVLYHIPVTKSWIKQFVLGVTLEGKSSYRGAIEICADLLDYKISLGTVHNIIDEAIQKAIMINNNEDLSGWFK